MRDGEFPRGTSGKTSLRQLGEITLIISVRPMKQMALKTIFMMSIVRDISNNLLDTLEILTLSMFAREGKIHLANALSSFFSAAVI